MIGLPATLAPWADELARLPTELAFALAPWVGRLALAAGPMAEARNARSGEPDGFTGLARRGSYERLLTTEWAVAELYPDEFARRAAGGEHLFLELARRGHQAARWAVAVVSAGPDQLGAPRLAHLAMLVVLARRAARGGATFSWGVLEDHPRLALIDDLDAVAVRRLLDARTEKPGGAAAVAAWTEALRGDPDVEIWWIGGAADVADARAAGDPCVIVHDVLEPGVRALDVEVRRRGGAARVRLALPPADQCARLLREPVAAPGLGRTARLGGVARSVRFGGGGKRIAVELANGYVGTWPVPNSPRDQIGRARRWEVPDDGRLLAYGTEQRSALAAVIAKRDPDVIHVSQPGALDRVKVQLTRSPGDFVDPPIAPLVPGRCAIVRERLVLAYGGGLYAVDELLHDTSRPRRTSVRHSEGSTVLAVALSSAGMYWIEHTERGAVVLRVERRDGTSSVEVRPPPGVDGRRRVARFGFDTEADEPLALVGWNQHACTVVAGRALHHVTTDAPAVGVGRWKRGLPALLLALDDRRLAWQLGGQRIAVPAAPDPITAIEVAEGRPYVAWMTTAGDVTLYSASHDAVVLHLLPGQEP